MREGKAELCAARACPVLVWRNLLNRDPAFILSSGDFAEKWRETSAFLLILILASSPSYLTLHQDHIGSIATWNRQ